MERGSSYNNENLKESIQSTAFDGSNTTEKCEIFQLIGSVITNDVGYTLQIKFNNAMAKVTFKKQKALLPGNLTLI